MSTLRLIIVLPLAFALSACAMFGGKEEDKTKDWSAQKFYSEAKLAMSEGDYEGAAKYYEGLEARYPFGKYAIQAQLDVAYAYYKAEEPESAIAAVDRFIKLNPRNPHVDYAYYLKGIINFNRNLGFLERFMPVDSSQRDPGAALDSFNDFAELVRLYPDSQYAADARKRMIYLRNNLARHEVHAAEYYLKRKAYLAAANRAVYVVQNYQRTPEVKRALEIMIEAYTQLGMEPLARDAQRVLAANEQQGLFAAPPVVDEGSTWSKSAWDYLELDKN